MNTVTFQLTAVLSLALFALTEWICLRFGGVFRDGFDRAEGEAMWILYGERVGQRRIALPNLVMRLFTKKADMKTTIALDENQYYMGNRYRDHLFIDAPGPRVKLLLNVHPDVVYVSVLKGSVQIANYEYEANHSQRIPLREFDKLKIGSVNVHFRKGGKRIGSSTLHGVQW